MARQKFIFIVLVFLSVCFASCNDDEEVHVDEIAGQWTQVYDKGVVAEGYTKWTFNARATDYGNLTVVVSDVFAGDSTYQYTYTIDAATRRLNVFEEVYGLEPKATEYEIVKLTGQRMTLHLVGTDVAYNFRRSGN